MNNITLSSCLIMVGWEPGQVVQMFNFRYSWSWDKRITSSKPAYIVELNVFKVSPGSLVRPWVKVKSKKRDVDVDHC